MSRGHHVSSALQPLPERLPVAVVLDANLGRGSSERARDGHGPGGASTLTDAVGAPAESDVEVSEPGDEIVVFLAVLMVGGFRRELDRAVGRGRVPRHVRVDRV